MRLVRRRTSSGFGVCVIKDVSEEKKREEQWRLDLERVQLTEEILDSLPFALSVKDRGLNYAAVNRAMCRLMERDAEKIIGRNDRELLQPDIAAMFELSDRRALDNGGLLAYPEQVKGFGEGGPFMTYKWRVGKPGRNFLVTMPQDMAAMDAIDMRGLVVMGGVGTTPLGETYVTQQACSGQRVLLVTAHDMLAEQAVKTLVNLGFDSCAVRDEAELGAFLSLAGDASVGVDLIVIDSHMDVACLELARRHDVAVLPLDSYQIANQLGLAVARALNGLQRPVVADPARPVAAEMTLAANPATGGCDADLDVLVAEDNDVNRILFSQILEGLGYSYAIAGNGRELVDLWQERRPRILLVDTTLPDMSGEDAVREIRLCEATQGGRVPVIGVLARAVDGDRESCLAAGMDDTLLKPLSPAMVEAAIRHFLSDGHMAETA